MDVFISYRREGGYAMARLLYEHLQNVGISAFLDLEELHSGPFNVALYEAIEKSENFVLVLPPDSLCRCQEENDWLRLEAEHAIKLKKNIIPLMLQGFSFPQELPPSLQALPFFNGVQVSREYFNASMKKLISMLNGVKVSTDKNILSDRQDDVRYYTDEDEQEKHRLRTEDKLLSRYESPIVQRLLQGKKNAVCLDVNVLNVEGAYSRFNYPEVSKVIALTYSEDILNEGNAINNGEDISFFKVQFESDDFESQLEECLDSAGVDGIDFVCLSMAIMDFKKPFKVLSAIHSFLNDDAVMIVRDVDDGAVFAYPDKEGYFKKFQSFYLKDKYSGYRYTGRQVYFYVSKLEPKSICLERYGINTADMSRRDKKALFEMWFSFIPNDFKRILREEPDSKLAREVLEFCEEHYDDLYEQFFSHDTLFSSGYVIYSVRF